MCHYPIMVTQSAEASTATVRMGPQGRIVVPAELRRALGLAEGSILGIRVVDGSLVLESRNAVFERMRRRFDSVPSERSLSQEVIDARIEEDRRENER